ncbi:structural maintenance of chromosomes protein 6B-like [Senna tora]|uniref:Structural maintenance of chromosomes protein 6B-like n=1 Tax=Senna tora TaxID=362788 RepID=A0A834SNL0_9FABA|nr:structural maintenance of chromosomes protein 6B-like [Senna tora]
MEANKKSEQKISFTASLSRPLEDIFYLSKAEIARKGWENDFHGNETLKKRNWRSLHRPHLAQRQEEKMTMKRKRGVGSWIGSRELNGIEKRVWHIETLEEQLLDMHEKHVKNTQAEEYETESLKGLQNKIDAADLALRRLKEEAILAYSVHKQNSEIRKIADEIEDHERRVSAFAGYRVMNLLRIIER